MEMEMFKTSTTCALAPKEVILNLIIWKKSQKVCCHPSMTRKYLKNFMNFTRKVLNYLIFSQAYSEAMWGNVEVVAEYLLDITEERKMFNLI